MNTFWTELLWRIILALTPIIVTVVVTLVQAMVARMSVANRDKLEYWIDTFVLAAQKQEPDPALRKTWVINKICGMFPILPRGQVSALIEAILASDQLAAGVPWSALPPETKTDNTPIPNPTITP